MNILAIETSTETAFITLKIDNEIYTYTENLGKKHSTLLFEKLDNLIKESGSSMEEIDILGAGIGPGSFTGVRITVSTMRALSQTLKKPLVGIKSHDLYAASMTQTEDYKLIAFDAKKNRVFAGIYKNENNREIKNVLPAGDYEIKEIFEKIPNGSRIFCVGDGFSRYRDEIDQFSNEKSIQAIEDNNFELSGKAVTDLFEKTYTTNPEDYADLNRIVPFYARKSDAETARDEKK